MVDSLRFDERGKHAMEELLKGEATDPLTLLLKGLALQLSEQDQVYVAPMVGPSKQKRRPSTMMKNQKVDQPDQVLDQHQRLPTLQEMASRFKYWLILYQSRLKNSSYEQWKQLMKKNPICPLTQSQLDSLVNQCRLDEPQFYTNCQSVLRSFALD